tara:strand:- start:430 stop:1137 length:708 start_codon:yes stop_codon:yes gene_type:complete
VEKNSSKINGIALPLNELQDELQRSQPQTLNGDPINILRDLPKGTGFVLRFSLNERDQMARIRRSFTEAATKLRIQDTSRGLLMTSSRVEADVISLYAWFTGDDIQEQIETTHEELTEQDANGGSSTPDGATTSHEQPLTLAAAELGVSVKTIRRAIKSGRLPARLIPGPHGPEYRVDVRHMLANSSSNQQIKHASPDTKRRATKDKSQPKESEEIALLSQRINELEDKINRISQ